jgi:branched-chain amino acid transport system ATP-binding protein
LLRVDDIHTYIGPFYIIQGVSFEVKKGEAVILLGRNGAGKSTLLSSIIGIIPPKGGRIIFKGEELQGQPTHEIIKKGIGYVPSGSRVFRGLTVEENLKVAFRSSGSSFEDRLDFVLDIFPDLKGAMKRSARHLSGGQQKMLSIAGVMTNKNDLLLVDEPSEGLSPSLIKKFTETIIKLKEETTIVLVEQNFRMAREIGDTCYILDKGKITHHGLMEEIAENKELLKKYLGVSI